MHTTTFVVGCGTCLPQGKLPTKATKELESSLTLCVMSWTCSSHSAAMTMSGVMEDMMMGSSTPLAWPRVRWYLGVHKNRLYLWLVQVPFGSLLCEEGPSKHTSDPVRVLADTPQRSSPVGDDPSGGQEDLPF